MNSFRSALASGRAARPRGPEMPEKSPTGTSEERGLESVRIPRAERRTANHRDEDRHRLTDETARMKVGRKFHQVDLVNLSGGGAMVRTDVELNMAQHVFLELGECEGLEGRVCWIRGDRVGIEFAPETQVGGDPATRDRMLLEVIRKSFPDLKTAPKAPHCEELPIPAEPESQRRSELRHPLIWRGEIHYNHDSEPVRLRNISERGALVEATAYFPPDAEVLLDLGEAGQLFATVSWARGDQVGLRFDSPFDVTQLCRAAPGIAGMDWQPPDYLSDADNGGASGWGHASIDQLRDELEGWLSR